MKLLMLSWWLASGFDCTLKKPEDWDIAKRAYCCRNPPYYCAPYNRGCDAPCLYANVTLSCQARIRFRHRVSYSKQKDGCVQAFWDVADQCPVCHACLAKDLGCNHSRMDCSGDPVKEKWDDGTREFCCLKIGKACPSLVKPKVKEEESLFDCEDHHWDWTTSWSEPQKAWCCEQRNQGCKGMRESKAPHSQAHIPDEDFQIILRAEEMLKRQGMTLESLRAPALSPSFNCDADESSWTQSQKDWCCEKEQKGCSQPALHLTYDCQGDVQKWSRAKRDWCCIHQVVGCEEVKDKDVKFSRAPVAGKAGGKLHQDRGYSEFDCSVEVDNWQFAWADEQKAACCKSVGIGCKEDDLSFDYPEPSESDNFFDCSKGRPSEWSSKKRTVCCASNADCQRRLRGV